MIRLFRDTKTITDARHGVNPFKGAIVPNRDIDDFVRARQPVRNNSWTIVGFWVSQDIYAIFSYGLHWPLFVYSASEGVWLENEEKCSMTTSHHRMHAHPHGPTVERSKDALVHLLQVTSQEIVHDAA